LRWRRAPGQRQLFLSESFNCRWPSTCQSWIPISQRYERSSIALTINKPFKQWASIFNNDSTIASAVLDRLDRLLHHTETVVIKATSYRMKDQVGE
jgi:DNA replication protein DnaC